MIGENPTHQSARSSCPIMILPANRQFGRPVWKWLWRCSRILWRDNGKKIEAAMVDSIVFGTGYWKPDHSGI